MTFSDDGLHAVNLRLQGCFGDFSLITTTPSGKAYTDPKRKRGFRGLSPRLRFGLVWNAPYEREPL